MLRGGSTGRTSTGHNSRGRQVREEVQVGHRWLPRGTRRCRVRVGGADEPVGEARPPQQQGSVTGTRTLHNPGDRRNTCSCHQGNICILIEDCRTRTIETPTPRSDQAARELVAAGGEGSPSWLRPFDATVAGISCYRRQRWTVQDGIDCSAIGLPGDPALVCPGGVGVRAASPVALRRPRNGRLRWLPAPPPSR